MIRTTQGLDTAKRIRNLVHRVNLNPVAFYPGSFVDFNEPLLMTGFSKLICVDSLEDKEQLKEQISEELSRTNHVINDDQGGILKIQLSIHGLQKEIDYHYGKSIEKFDLRKIPSFDVLISNGFSLNKPRLKHAVFSKLTNKGLFITNTDRVSNVCDHSGYMHKAIASDNYNVYMKKQDIPLNFFLRDFRLSKKVE